MAADLVGLAAEPSVVLCPEVDPSSGDPDWEDAATQLSQAGITVVRPTCLGPDLARWVVGIADAITDGAPTGPLVLAAKGNSVPALAPLGVALRARRHRVVGYVVIDTDLTMPMEAGGDWPGAPVTYVGTPGAAGLGWRVAGLRGWDRISAEAAAGILRATRLR